MIDTYDTECCALDLIQAGNGEGACSLKAAALAAKGPTVFLVTTPTEKALEKQARLAGFKQRGTIPRRTTSRGYGNTLLKLWFRTRTPAEQRAWQRNHQM